VNVNISRQVCCPGSKLKPEVWTAFSRLSYLDPLLSNNSYGKDKGVPLYAMKAPGGERRYSFYSFSASALDGGEWSASRPGRALPPVPLDRRLGGPQSRSGLQK
jgi:hypothetical protein